MKGNLDQLVDNALTVQCFKELRTMQHLVVLISVNQLKLSQRRVSVRLVLLGLHLTLQSLLVFKFRSFNQPFLLLKSVLQDKHNYQMENVLTVHHINELKAMDSVILTHVMRWESLLLRVSAIPVRV